MSFLVAAPEVNSAQLYAGAGVAPMLEAAVAWTRLADELGTAASSFSSMVSNLVASSWQGPASVSMTAVAAPYARWLDAAATQAGGAAVGAKGVAAVYEVAKAAVVHPGAIASNRNRVVSLVVSNLFGFNAPAIAAGEAEYEEMWAVDVAAMVGYHSGASAVAEQLVPWTQALRALPGQVAGAVGAGPVGAAAAVNPAATALEYGLIAALLATPLVAAVGNVSLVVSEGFTDVAVALAPVTTAVTAGARAAIAPVVTAIAETPIVAAATAALAPVANQLATAVTAAANGATATVAQLAAVASSQVDATLGALQSAALSQQLALVAGNPALLSDLVNGALSNPALLSSIVPVLASNPALVTNAFALLASNPQLVTGLVAQLENNPALVAQLFAAYAQLEASNPALAAQLASMGTQLASQLGIGQAV